MNKIAQPFFSIQNFCRHFLPILVFALLPCCSIAQNQAPVLTATGDKTYCPGSVNYIADSFSITDPDDNGLQAIYVQISSGYENTQDALSLSGSHPGITASWSAAEGKLSITGNAGQEVPYADLIAAIEDVVYTNSSTNPIVGTRTFSITIGQANYLESTGHYYLYIASEGISWTAAKNAAAASTYYGWQGYLATILSQDEAQLIGEQALGTGWIGGSDQQTEGVWRWVTGPEAGTVFWNGGVGGSTTNFAFWNTGEPNNQDNEDYAHITAPGVGIPGSWNDLPVSGSVGAYAPQGYIVEFGGMPGDPPLQISATTSITIKKITGTTPGSACGSGPVTLQATVSGGIVYWYTTPTGGSPVSTGSSYTTPAITSNTTYYASAYDASCTSGTRTAVMATIFDLPTVTATTPAPLCGQGTATLSGTPSAGSTIRWYDAATGGTQVGSGNSITSPTLNATTTFYAEATSTSGCVSASRTPVTVTVNALPVVTLSDPAPLCGPGTATLSATTTSGTINWYDDAVAGNLIGTGTSITSPSVSTNTNYYAEAVSAEGCISASRAVAQVTISPLPSVVSAAAASLCQGGSATISAIASSGTINWYDQPTGGTLLYTGNSYNTPNITATTTYYAEAVSPQGCIAAARSGVTVTVNTLPTVTAPTPVTICAGTPATLSASGTGTTINWYSQQTGGTILSSGATFTTPNLSSSATYYAEAVSAAGCASATRAAITVNVNPYPVVTATDPLPICGSGSVSLTATITSGTVNWYDSATGGNLIGSGTTIQSPSVNANTVFYAEGNDNGCLSNGRTPVTVTVNPLPTVSTTANEAYICEEGTATIEASASEGVISWYDQPAGGTMVASGDSFTTPVLNENTIYYAEAVSSEGCVSATRSAITVTISMLPTLTADASAIVCFGGTVILEAIPSDGEVYWYDAPDSTTPIATGEQFSTPELTADMTYYAEAQHNGCTSLSREAVTVTVVPLPEALPGESVIFCENSAEILDATIAEDVTYEWSTGATTPQLTIREAGTYTVTITNANGCTDGQTFTAETTPAPQIDQVQVSNTDDATIVMEDNSLQYEYSLDGFTYQDSPVFRGLKDGIYIAFARSLNGCGVDSREFRVLLVQPYFTPNSDSVNDVFTIAGMASYPKATVTVFDRYGKVIIQLNRTNREWDGTYNGHRLPATDYWYIIKLDDDTPEIHGHVSLVR